MHKLLLFISLLSLSLLFTGGAIAQDDEEDLPVIGFVQFVSHPALDAGVQGAADYLEANGFVDSETARFIFANGEGDIPTLSLIIEDFLDEGVDVIIAVSTPALQAAYGIISDLEEPAVFFNTVTNPYAAGVAQAPCVHPAWLTGSQALAPFEATVPLVFDIVPNAETIGLIYNDAEVNSVVSTEIVLEIGEELGLEFEIQTVANSSEVPVAAEALISRGIDAFYVTTDSTVVAGLEGLVQVANDNAIPIVGSDPASAQRGAVIAQGLDYYQEGIDTGRMVVAYLNGELDIATTSISRQVINELALNLDAAQLQGVTLSDELIERASILIEDGEVTRAERAEVSEEEMAEADAAFLEGLVCTEEMIEDQMEALEDEDE